LNNIYFQNYLEPFCGSLGVLKNMTDLPTHIVANDYHSDLIEMWKCVRDKTLVFPESVVE
jgi:site-specific DNA-adenine methylase